jgi:hypothetical protein
MSAEQFVNIDGDVPSFDEWNDDDSDFSTMVVIPQDEDEDPDSSNQNPATLGEVLDMIRRLHIFSSSE